MAESGLLCKLNGDRTPLPHARKRAGAAKEPYSYHTDAQGSVVALTSATGSLAAAYAYDPFGRPTLVWGSDPTLADRQPLRYRGYYYDTGSGLYCLPARCYDPVTARFLSPDPAPASAGSPLSLNRFAYCLGDPVNHSDPTGAITDTDGNGRTDAWDSAMWASRHTKDPVRKAYFKARASVAYESARARQQAQLFRSGQQMVQEYFGPFGDVRGLPDGDGTAYGRSNDILALSKPDNITWGSTIFGNAADGLGSIPGAGACFVLAGIVGQGAVALYYREEWRAGNATKLDYWAAGVAVVPYLGSLTSSTICSLSLLPDDWIDWAGGS